MNKRISAAVIVASTVLSSTNPAGAAESYRLTVPVYPGSAPGVPFDGRQVPREMTLVFDGGTTLDCSGTTQPTDFGGRQLSVESLDPNVIWAGPWCFLTKDPIDKVRAFYDKAVGKMVEIRGADGVHGYQVFSERYWFPGAGEESPPGFSYRGVSVHALPPPKAKGREPAAPAMGDETWVGQEDYSFYAQTRHFGIFLEAVDFFGDPTKRRPAELDRVYEQHKQLESALFQRKGPDLVAVDRTLADEYGRLMGERRQAAMSGTIAAQMQHGMSAPQAGPTEEEDQQFNAVMAGDPALAQRYMQLTQQSMALMQQGKFDEADAILEEIDELEQSNPQLAAMANQQQGRVDAIQAADLAAEQGIRAAGNTEMDKALWGTSMEYLQAAEKEAYYTLIVIDHALNGTEEQYSRDRKTIDNETMGTLHISRLDGWGIGYDGPLSGSNATAPPGEQPAEEEGLGGKAKKALSILKRPF